ncbi:hypothetical protein ACSU64_05480 [Bacillaceae bacterium C204]|uniref:hypothetical protein n=1 Tax=Neobacillus sp. 204 TaxID=3383351 RepID=UPI00397C752E
MNLKLATRVDVAWVWYESPDYRLKPTLRPESVGKFMTFGEGDISSDLQQLILNAIKHDITPVVKHTNIESEFKNFHAKDNNSWVICWYSNDDINSLKLLAKYLVDNNLVQRTKAGKLYNISFKYDNQTRNAEYGDLFTAKITLSDFLDLYTGELFQQKEVTHNKRTMEKWTRKKYQLSEHFINFVIKGKEFDIDAFNTREEFDQYKEELEDYKKNPDSERFKDIFKYLKE